MALFECKWKCAHSHTHTLKVITSPCIWFIKWNLWIVCCSQHTSRLFIAYNKANIVWTCCQTIYHCKFSFMFVCSLCHFSWLYLFNYFGTCPVIQPLAKSCAVDEALQLQLQLQLKRIFFVHFTGWGDNSLEWFFFFNLLGNQHLTTEHWDNVDFQFFARLFKPFKVWSNSNFLFTTSHIFNWIANTNATFWPKRIQNLCEMIKLDWIAFYRELDTLLWTWAWLHFFVNSLGYSMWWYG